MRRKLLVATALMLSSALGVSAQNVGIGITSPQYPLDVKGVIRSANNGAASGGLLLQAPNGTATTFFSMLNDTVIGLSKTGAGSYSMLIDVKNFRVGAGYGTPRYPLHVYGNDTALAVFNNSQSNAAGVKSGLYFSNNTYFTGGISTVGQNANEASLAFFTSSGSNLSALQQRMTISDDGLVGIGRTAPRMMLDISASDSAVLLLENKANQATGIKTGMYLKSGNRYMGGLAAIGTSGVDARLGFYTYSSSSFSGLKEQMTMLDNGNVGINTIAPTAKLDVNGTVRLRDGAGAGLVLTSDADGNATWEMPTITSANYGTSAANSTVINVPKDVNIIPSIRFNTVTYDDGNIWNDSIFTAPVAGVYHFDVSVIVNFNGITAANDNTISLYSSSSGGSLNSAYVNLPNSASGIANTISLSFDEKLSPGDTYKFKIGRSFILQGGGTVTVPVYRAKVSAHLVY